MPYALILVLFAFFSIDSVNAAPYRPLSDDEVVERLPLSPYDPVLSGMRALNARLKAEPENLPLALQIARSYLDLGRKSGDPRYVGYAQAVLAPWWDLERPPIEIAMIRAAVRQRLHLFDSALKDLAHVIASDPRNAQARLMRATVLQVVGASAAAREDCDALPKRRYGLIHTACAANVDGVTGRLKESYETLSSAVTESSSAPAPVRSWALTLLAELEERANHVDDAEAHFKAALNIDADDAYLLAAYADFLLDSGRATEVENLLKGREQIDPLLLRLALAAKSLRSDALTTRVSQLRERFQANRMRGDEVHLREEARFLLELLDEPENAAALAKANWRVQKEPADIRILIEAAHAANDGAALQLAQDWIKQTGFEDLRLTKLISTYAQPKRETVGNR